MALLFSAANFVVVTASWPVFGVWSVERGPATMDTSEICSPEALVGTSYDRPKFRILSAKRGTQTRLPCSSLLFTYILMPLSGASARALVATPSVSRPRRLRYAHVRRGAAAISSHIALNVWLCCPRRRPLSCDEHHNTTCGLAMRQHRWQQPSFDVLGRIPDGWRMTCRLNGPLRSCSRCRGMMSF